MTSDAPIVFVDADVLWGSLTTNLLMTLGTSDGIALRWSQPVLDEVKRSVLRSDPTARVRRRIDHMVRSLPEAAAEGFDHLTAKMPAHPKDRHVLAAAVHSRAEVLITENVRHFHPERTGLAIEVMRLDDFARAMLMKDRQKMMSTLDTIVARHRHSPRDLQTFVATAASRQQLRGFAIDVNRLLPLAQPVAKVGTISPPLSPAAQRFAAGRRRPPRRRGSGFER